MIPNHDINVVLTPNIIKQRHFSKDKDYSRALDLLNHTFDSHPNKLSYLWNTAAIIIRPDAIAGHMTSNIFPLLKKHGFFPCAVRVISISEKQVEALWRYQWNVATTERQNLLKRIMTAGQAIYLLLKDETVRKSAPATVHLSYLKGTSRIDRRKLGHLRTAAGPAIANIFSYLHIADDPADVLREQALLFSDEEVTTLMKESMSASNKQDMVNQKLSTLERLIPTGTFSLELLKTELDSGDAFSEVLRTWQSIIRDSLDCINFITGDAYEGKDAIIPDDSSYSLPLDEHLVCPDIGPP